MVSEAISLTTRPETEVGPRPIKSGLGDLESGVSGVDEGPKNASISMSKWGWLAVSDRASSSDVVGSDNENLSENRNDFDETKSTEVVDACLSTS